MTPLKPLENTTEVHGVMADRYPPNEVCAHPECDKPTESVHHIFGRPPGLHSDSWFVNLRENLDEPRQTIPHAIGLCGNGTMGHHGELESHETWIKLEDGVFVLYARELEDAAGTEYWRAVGPLDPQPAGRVKSGKPKRTRFSGEARKKRRTISIAVPAEAQEDGGAVWDELLGDGKQDRPYGRVRERLDAEGVDGNRSPYYVIVDALNDWLNS